MQGRIDEVKKSKSGKPIVKIGMIDYFSKEENPLFVVGKEIMFQSTTSSFKGKTYNWVVEGSVVEAFKAAGSAGASNEDKNRSFAASYAKDMVVANRTDPADIENWKRIYRQILNILNEIDEPTPEDFPVEE